MDKFFPIKVDPACKLKWSWSTIRLRSGTSSSCHRVQDVPVSSFDNFHNTPEIIDDREKMLAGEWPTGRGCEFCKVVEDAGGTSDRMFHNSIPNQYPTELDQDATAVNVTPTILEVYFDNVCNMSCLYCHSGFSSKIEAENNRNGRFESQGVVIENRTKFTDENFNEYTEQFWQWMQKNSTQLSRFHFLGGEPFFQPQFDQFLEFLENSNNPNLEFNVITNLKVKTKKLKDYIQRIKCLVDQNKIKRLDITASIDCFGDAGEYVRNGLDLEEWKRNFTYLVSEEWIVLNINQTISCLTIKTVPELIEFINQFDGRDIGHYFGTTVKTHSFLHPDIFSYEVFKEDFDIILGCMKEDTWQQKAAINNMQGMIAKLQKMQYNNKTEIDKLVVFLDEMDRRRGTDWRKTFPWLEEYVVY